MMHMYEFSGKTVIDIDAEVPEEILEDIDWNMLEVGNPIHDDSGDIIAKVAEVTEYAVTIVPVEE